MEKTINITLKVWRQKGPKEKGRFEEYKLNGVSTDSSFLEMLDLLNEQLINEGKEPVVFDHDCREGICGSDGMNINGKNGLACLINMNTLPEKVTVRPLPGLPVVRDLVVDMNQFYEQYEKVHPFLINDQPAPATERL